LGSHQQQPSNGGRYDGVAYAPTALGLQQQQQQQQQQWALSHVSAAWGSCQQQPSCAPNALGSQPQQQQQ
jgi:hypothetical protein